MPYQTPSASQYTMIKRLQTNVTGKAALDPTKLRAPSAFGGYFAGLANINALPPNAITSNKFIQPPSAPFVEVNFAGESYFRDPVLFPSTTTVTFRFIAVGNMFINNCLNFQLSDYNFNSSTLVITSPSGLDLSVNAFIGGVQFISNVSFSDSAEWLLTLTVPTPISQLDSILFEHI